VTDCWSIETATKIQKCKPAIDFPGRDVNLATSIILTAYWQPFWRCVHRCVTLYGPLNSTNILTANLVTTCLIRWTHP